ncbi:L-aspartate oxidase [Planococcus halotolerans]|uniref:L-aspartate oxidase n=1 Tax=Planococcus halotolerans TaxID=2233542 RepID=UPI0010932674|nr:L-aspartate oxidase [Planococcus halotolerans]QHJ71274.1 L-aspartate oxidase [Planococcus halotolerans]
MFDVCIIGGGAAGLMLAHSLPSSYKIAVLTKASPENANSSLAQGGIAASLHPSDSPAAHASDTLTATAGHSNPQLVDILTTEGASVLRQLMEEGLPYDKDETGQPALGIEGAHSTRRILHSGGDQTGKMLMAYLMKKTEDKIRLFHHHQALDLVIDQGQCRGVVACDESGSRKVIYARHTVLATGGIGALYSHTSNSPVAEGDGLSLAYRAGAVLEDLEFVQFHPTILTIDGKAKGLISEAVRGEGALLVNKDGKAIMENIHPLKELAPRDIVARTIEWHWQEKGAVFLDARHIDGFGRKFPAILKNCLAHGIDPALEGIPVRPGAHFHMGGVKTDENGATTVRQLYAIGEIASTGVHGANRLASNSLLEAIVFAKRLADFLVEQSDVGTDISQNQDRRLETETLPAPFRIPDSDLLRLKMTHAVGILRDKAQLKKFIADFPLLPVGDLLELSNSDIGDYHRTTASLLIATAAFIRDESRGAHFRMDLPHPSAEWQGKVIGISLDGIAITDRKIHSKETVQ